jgi:hypothetical protein
VHNKTAHQRSPAPITTGACCTATPTQLDSNTRHTCVMTVCESNGMYTLYAHRWYGSQHPGNNLQLYRKGWDSTAGTTTHTIARHTHRRSSPLQDTSRHSTTAAPLDYAQHNVGADSKAGAVCSCHVPRTRRLVRLGRNATQHPALTAPNAQRPVPSGGQAAAARFAAAGFNSMSTRCDQAQEAPTTVRTELAQAA